MLGPTIDPSGLQDPPGSSLHQSVTWVKSSSRGLGSFTSNTAAKKSHVIYHVVGDGIGMCNDMGIKFSENCVHRNIYPEISCMFAGTGIGCLCTQEINFS